jgi:hypothetical protein
MLEMELLLEPHLDFYLDWYMAIRQETFRKVSLLDLLLVLQSVRYLTL